MRLLIIGGSGLVGTNLLDFATERDIEARGTYLDTDTSEATIPLDKTDFDQTRNVLKNYNPDVVVDTAAFHHVDTCETQRARSWNVNAAGTRNVAVAAKEVDAHLVYLSTDYVFPGDPGESPYTESDPIQPVNYYAETKYAAERATRIAETATILRPSVIYGLANSNFVTWALNELSEGNEISIVNDQISAPTYAPDLARACIDIAKMELTGLFHSTGPTSISRYEFTVTLADVYGHDPELVSPVTTEEFGQTAPRPADSTLNSSQLYDALGWRFRTPKESFTEMRTMNE